MKTSTTENSTISKREDKKSINIKWNSGLFFQLGIIVSMLLVFLVAESSIGSTTVKDIPVHDFYLTEPAMTDYIVEKPIENVPKPKEPVKQPPKREKLVSIHNKMKPVDDQNTAVTKTPTTSVETLTAPETGPEVIDIEPKKHYANTVEFVPIFPGCESLPNNKERVACMSSKINKFIGRNFDTEKFSGALDRGELQRISVQFKVDTTGKITDIKARSQFKPFEKEAIRVLKKLPFITPGKQGDRKVDVIYNVPIVFKMGY